MVEGDRVDFLSIFTQATNRMTWDRLKFLSLTIRVFGKPVLEFILVCVPFIFEAIVFLTSGVGITVAGIPVLGSTYSTSVSQKFEI
jgi:hypothetical protein